MNNTDKDNNSTIEKSLDKDKNDENKRDLTRRGYGRINEEIKEENKLEKIKAPKRRYAIIHGYVGHNYSGNQKNPGVTTVEDVLETALFKNNLISECNYGTIQKIGWSRASRTDKKVSAAMNIVSCKLHYYCNIELNSIKEEVNKLLPKDIRILKLIEVSSSFNAKDCSNNREYHYILPSFCLKPKIISSNKIEENIDYDYNYKVSNEYKEKIETVLKCFRGSKKYHNYTKKLTFSDSQSLRTIYEVTIEDIIQFDQIECIKFKLVGQSFLYNQIRKMIGMVVSICRDVLDIKLIEKSFGDCFVNTPKAPAEGLYLYRIDYSKYNTKKVNKKNNIDLNDKDIIEINEFSKELINKVNECELKDKCFTNWLKKYDSKEYVY